MINIPVRFHSTGFEPSQDVVRQVKAFVSAA